MLLRSFLFLGLSWGLHACTQLASKTDIPADQHSYAQPNKALATHLQWTGTVDFASKSIIAKASWVIQAQEGVDTVVFDTYGLEIEKVTVNNQQSTGWVLDPADSILGRALRIQIPENIQLVHIHYRTSSMAKGLQWLDAAQTSNKKHPFLFSQGQAILTRSWLPCQDSPALRFSFDAQVTVPSGLMAVMSAVNHQKLSADGVYRFSNSKPIPSYLFALAVGDFAYQAFDERSGIYAEKSTLPAAWSEFANLPPMIKAAERLFGKMPWERFDILVLPPSFPFGGMENPMIMFAAPTLIAGDRSLTNLVAHELAHAWSDQLLSMAGWKDFWLNEFFTSYIERRIIQEMEGLSYAEMMDGLNNLELERNLKEGSNNKQALVLVPELTNKDPDFVLGAVKYQKVAALMMQLEAKLGKKKLDAWISRHLREQLPEIHTTQSFLSTYRDFLFSQEAIQAEDLDQWLHAAELPDSYSRRPSSRLASVEAVATLWLQGEEISVLPTGGWSVYEWMYFLRIINQGQLSQVRLAQLDKTMNLSGVGNAELKSVWFQLALQHNYLAVLPAVESYVAETGRRKLLMAVYKALWNNLLTKAYALQYYSQYQHRYHSVARQSIYELLYP